MFQKEHKNFQITLFVLSIVNIVLAILLVLVLTSVVLGHSIGTIFQMNEMGKEQVQWITNVLYGLLIAIASVNFFSAVYSIVSAFVFKSGFSIATSVITLIFGYFASDLFHLTSVMRWIPKILAGIT